MSITFWFNAYSMQKCLLSLLPLWRGFLNENILFLIIFPQQVPVSFPDSSDGKESAFSGDLVWSLGSIPGSGRSLGEGLGNPFQYSCLENPMDRRAWSAIGHRELDTTEWLTRTHTHPKLQKAGSVWSWLWKTTYMLQTIYFKLSYISYL